MTADAKPLCSEQGCEGGAVHLGVHTPAPPAQPEDICTDCPHPWDRHLFDGCQACTVCPNALLDEHGLYWAGDIS